MMSILQCPAHIQSQNGQILIGTIGTNKLLETTGADLSALNGKKQAFLLTVLSDGRLLIAGSDSHGTAYGIMEVSRLLGVSPWEWWADALPEKKAIFTLPAGYTDIQSPSVEYRGIFINDEDWGLMPWSSETYEPQALKGHIGPRTHERIFELLLRLRANTYWPAMHECTHPFFLTEGNRETAEKFGIYIGGSHCEPMASSTAGEWRLRGKGDYDYVNNKTSVYRFWEERVKEIAEQEILYTIGMRGVHDGQMQGAKSIAEQKAVLERVFTDQRYLLKKYVNKNVEEVPQVFIPYKEVLDIYNAGLQVPDDVTLMWCDDNYGYIRHFPTDEERARQGGNGLYYHISYWGRPHDYLWLGTFSPALLYQQLKQAYDRDIRKIWILNVGDIKPAEYQTELFMDMAWNINEVTQKGVSDHLKRFLQREFGKTVGRTLHPVMEEHYRLAYIRKPEFMGNTRVEDSPAYRVIKDLPWNRQFILERLAAYKKLSDKVEATASAIQDFRKETYFQLIKYPVQAATEMNKKMLYAQLARHGEMDWVSSQTAYDSIVTLTRIYNNGIDGKAKWKRIMDFQPRRLPVFEPIRPTTDTCKLKSGYTLLHKWNAVECTKGQCIPCKGLGYEGKSAILPKGENIHYEFTASGTDSIEIEIQLLPNHPVKGDRLRLSVMLDQASANVLSYETKGRSEEWKENVLRNQAVRRLILPLEKKRRHRIVLTALDEGVVLDRLLIYMPSHRSNASK